MVVGFWGPSSTTWSNTCQVDMNPRVTTSTRAGRSIGRVTKRNLCHGVAPSMALASSTSSPMVCMAARKNSMNVPDVVHTSRMMSTHMPTEGPATQFQSESPMNVWLPQPGLETPRALRIFVKRPLWS